MFNWIKKVFGNDSGVKEDPVDHHSIDEDESEPITLSDNSASSGWLFSGNSNTGMFDTCGDISDSSSFCSFSNDD